MSSFSAEELCALYKERFGSLPSKPQQLILFGKSSGVILKYSDVKHIIKSQNKQALTNKYYNSSNVFIKYGFKRFSMEIPTNKEYTIGDLKKDILLKSIINEPSSLLTFSINGTIIYNYKEQMLNIIKRFSNNLTIELIDPKKQISSSKDKIRDRLINEDPNRIKKQKLQKEWKSKTRKSNFKS